MDHEDGNTSAKRNAATGAVVRPNNIRGSALQKYSNDGALSVLRNASQGSYVVANRMLQPHEVLMSCPSASIALDPLHRHSHCGFCARPIEKQTPAFIPCQRCHLVTICHNCRDHGATEWHSQKGGECSLLLACVESFREVFTEFEGLTLIEAAQNVESIYVLTMRLLNRRGQQKQEISQVPCPLPDIDWNLFDTLYTSPLPSSAGASAVLTSMATLLHVMSSKLLEKQQPMSANASNTHKQGIVIKAALAPLDSAECVSIWNKCRGCCHAITDLTRPLGAQNLGMALFISQSFYNHACAPNAFLSCLLGGLEQEQNQHAATSSVPASAASKSSASSTTITSANDQNDYKCVVVSRVVYSSDKTLAKGSPVSLSYIPLSGLCRQERRMRLQETYHFDCCCQICQEAMNAVPDSEGVLIEQNVGGDFAVDNKVINDVGIGDNNMTAILNPLRELQIDCYNKLMQASKMETLKGNPSANGNSEDLEDNPRLDLIEQSIATLEMAQRGIRNHKIPPSHEVSLERHRLLAVAYSLLGQTFAITSKEKWGDAVDMEMHHQKEFFRGVEPAQAILDPSALTIQHRLMVQCLRAKLEVLKSANAASDKCSLSDDTEVKTVHLELQNHAARARSIALSALGGDHPFTLAQEKQLEVLSKKRKIPCE